MKTIKALIILAVLLFTVQAQGAAWTLTPSMVAKAGHYIVWKVLCTSDGSSMPATDLIALMNDYMKGQVQGATHMVMTVEPGTAGVIPDTTIDVTLSNAQGIPVFVHAGYSNVANTTGISLAEDYNQYLVPYGLFYLTLNDIGTAGDQVTLYFEAWIE